MRLPHRTDAQCHDRADGKAQRVSDELVAGRARICSAISPSEQDDGPVTVEQDATFAVPAHRT
jgi:hypothetical protein